MITQAEAEIEALRFVARVAARTPLPAYYTAQERRVLTAAIEATIEELRQKAARYEGLYLANAPHHTPRRPWEPEVARREATHDPSVSEA